jgi:hypothetical protein
MFRSNQGIGFTTSSRVLKFKQSNKKKKKKKRKKLIALKLKLCGRIVQN